MASARSASVLASSAPASMSTDCTERVYHSTRVVGGCCCTRTPALSGAPAWRIVPVLRNPVPMRQPDHLVASALSHVTLTSRARRHVVWPCFCLWSHRSRCSFSTQTHYQVSAEASVRVVRRLPQTAPQKLATLWLCTQR